MKLYALTEATLNQVLGYLAAKPFAEVTNLIADIQKAQLVVDGEGKAIEVPELETAPKASLEETPANDQQEATA